MTLRYAASTFKSDQHLGLVVLSLIMRLLYSAKFVVVVEMVTVVQVVVMMLVIVGLFKLLKQALELKKVGKLHRLY